MSHARKDTFAKPRVWNKHLRPEWKRRAAKDERREVRKQVTGSMLFDIREFDESV
jgi:hypothetical protein